MNQAVSTIAAAATASRQPAFKFCTSGMPQIKARRNIALAPACFGSAAGGAANVNHNVTYYETSIDTSASVVYYLTSSIFAGF
jgi:hypothetical protein